MKHFLRTLIFLIIVCPSYLYCKDLNIPCDILLPTASIAVTGSPVCQNGTNPVVTFTGSGGTAPYTFVYRINAGPNLTIITNSGSSITLQVPSSAAGTFNYQLVSVNDSTNTPQTSTGNIIVTITSQPDATINGTGSGTLFNGVPVFRICDNIISNFTFVNGSSTTTTLDSGYHIDWGDGTSQFDANTWTTLTHTYQVGLWNLTYTIRSNNGCPITKSYIVFVGSNPAVALGNPGNTNICNSSPLTFPITGTQNNPPGTTYTVTFNDTSPAQIFSHPPPLSVTHTFLISSCGVSSSSGTTTFQNSFSANIVASNPCGDSAVGVVPIYVSTPPIATFTIPANNICTNDQACFNNTSTGAYENNGSATSCNTSPKIVWSVSPSVGFSISSGTLGADNGFTDPNLWITGSNALCLNFNQPGTYIITIKTGNKCGFDTEIKTICVEAPLIPQFTLNPNNSCTPFAITPTNSTNISNQCSPTVYTWNVTYAPGNCGNAPPASFYTNGTTDHSPVPNFNFTTPGIYTITLTADNVSCSPVVSAPQTITIKNPPTVSITPIAAPCGTYTISPAIALEQNCGGSITNRNWSFPGSDTPTFSGQNPGIITYPGPGTYTISLITTNECGVSNTATQSFTLSQPPLLNNTTLSQSVCSGVPTALVALTGTPSTATFPWTATATGVTGFTISGTGTIPVQTLTATGSTPGTVTYIIRPTIGSCIGTSVNYIITVSPAPAINTQPQSSTVCNGGTPTQLAVAVNASAGLPQYQWYYNDINSNVTTASSHILSGATNSTYDPPSGVDGTRYYYCEISFSSGGCTMIASQTATVTVLPLPAIAVHPLASQDLCVGGQILLPLTVSYTGGTGSVTYQWFVNTGSGFSAIPSSNNAAYLPPPYTQAGTYSYYATVTLSGNNCGSATSNTAVITVYTDPVIDSQPITTQNICQGVTATTLTVTASGGNGIFTYQWFNETGLINAATGSSYLPLSVTVGTHQYYCEVSQSATSGCKVVSNIAAVTVNAAPTITVQPLPDTICQGGMAQTMTVTAINGIGTPTYEWFSNNTNLNSGGISEQSGSSPNFTPSSTAVGTVYYYCVVYFTGTGNCSQAASQTAVVTVNPGASVNLQPTPLQEVCTGAALPALTVGYNGGTGTATYQWYYNTINATTGGQLMQQGSSPSYIPANIILPGTYFYYATVSFSGNGCGSITSNTAMVNVLADPIINVQPLLTQSLCQTVNATPLTVSASGGSGNFSYQWYQNNINNTTSGTLINGATTDTYIPDTATIGTFYYYCVITQTGLGCETKSTTSAVIVSPAPVFTLQPVPSIICLGQTTPPLSIAYSNGAGIPEYHWFYNTIATTVGATPTGTDNTTFIPPVNSPGTLYYFCIVRLPSGGCTEIISNIVAITVNQYPVIAPATAVICSGTDFIIAPDTIAGNIVPPLTTYTWPAPVINPPGTINGAAAESTGQSQISQLLVNSTISAATVTYIITPISGVCPGTPFTITVTVNPSITPNVTVTNNTCFGINNAGIQTNITGGIPFSSGVPYIIVWNGPNGFTSSNSSIGNIEPGTYTLSITDAGGCPILETYAITEPDDIIIITDVEKDITCFGDADGGAAFTVTGGTLPYSYVWTKDSNPASFAFTEDLSGLSPGLYSVSVTDANSCGPKIVTFNITEPPVLSLNLISQTNVLCFGDATGAITVNAGGGTPIEITPGVFDYAYSWTGPSGFTSTNKNLSGILAGTYDLIVTDAHGCTKMLSVTIIQNPEIIITAVTTPITCYGANNASIALTLSGGIPPYQATWSNLATGTFQDNLSAGTYIITITDGIGCQKPITIIIPEAPVFMVTPVVKNISCFGAHDGSINLNLAGGIPVVTLQWSDGSTAGTIRNNLGAGTYTATISDGTPCYITRTFTILEPQQLVLTANTTHALDCNNANSGAINLLIAGGSPPFSYSWSNGAVTEDLSAISAGNYQVTVTDANGCRKTEQYTISRQQPITIVINTNTIFDCETRYVQQTFVADVSGGIPPCQLHWSGGTISGTNNEMMQTDSNGTYILTVTDSFGCIANHSFVVDTPELGTNTFNTTSYSYSTFGLYSVVDPIQFTGIVTGNYIGIAWNFGDGTVSTELNPIHIYTSPGDYVVTQTVTYPFGCIYVYKISLMVEKGYVLEVPDAFTPNKDTLNDFMRPVFKGLKTVRMDVYDTWGALLFSEEGETLKGWDGRVKGIDVENGNYYCKVQATTFYNQTISKAQPFTLIK